MPGGDDLARGAVRHSFPSLSHISQDRWNQIWVEAKEAEEKVTRPSVPKSAHKRKKSTKK